MRRLSRNTLWASVILILCGAAADAHFKYAGSWLSIVVGVFVAAACVSLMVTVHVFRRAYHPILRAYQMNAPLEESEADALTAEADATGIQAVAV